MELRLVQLEDGTKVLQTREEPSGFLIDTEQRAWVTVPTVRLGSLAESEQRELSAALK